MDSNAFEIVILPVVVGAGLGTACGAAWVMLRRAVLALGERDHHGQGPRRS